MIENPERRAFVLCAGLALMAGSARAAQIAGTVCGNPGENGKNARFFAPPKQPPQEILRLLGQYGGENGLTIYERDGLLHADGAGLRACRLVRLEPDRFRVEDGPQTAAVELRFDPDANPPSVMLNSQRLAWRDVGAEIEAKIRAGVRSDAGRLRAAALRADPPHETGSRRAFDLVSLPSLDPSLRIDLRYATRNNLLGIQIYERAAALLQRPAASALARVSAALRCRGYGLVIYDAYRPWFATRMFWDATPPALRMFVADPAQGSRHNRGCAVDIGLYELSSGHAVEMPSRYDEFTKRAFADYIGGTGRQRWYRDLLRREMESEEFTVYPQEWWHFDHKDWSNYPIGVATFSQLVVAIDVPKFGVSARNSRAGAIRCF